MTTIRLSFFCTSHRQLSHIQHSVLNFSDHRRLNDNDHQKSYYDVTFHDYIPGFVTASYSVDFQFAGPRICERTAEDGIDEREG
jgi:hypothetical protein